VTPTESALRSADPEGVKLKPRSTGCTREFAMRPGAVKAKRLTSIVGMPGVGMALDFNRKAGLSDSLDTSGRGLALAIALLPAVVPAACAAAGTREKASPAESKSVVARRTEGQRESAWLGRKALTESRKDSDDELITFASYPIERQNPTL